MYLCTKLTNMIRELLSKRERPMEQVSDFELEQIAVEEARLNKEPTGSRTYRVIEDNLIKLKANYLASHGVSHPSDEPMEFIDRAYFEQELIT